MVTVANDNEQPTGKVIQFPKKGKPQKEIVIDNSGAELLESMMFAEHLTEGLVVNLVHNLAENGINTGEATFIKDLGFIIELVKATIHRDMGINHPIQDFVDLFVSTKDEEGKLVTRLDIDLIEDIVANLIEEE
jgi:hypothetical protein